jgi:hypothetical protein
MDHPGDQAPVAIIPTDDLPFLTIERVAQWTFAEMRCRMPWMVDRELAFNKGLTARPRRAGEGGWATSEMCAGMGAGKTRMRIPVPINPQAEIVIEAVKRLHPRAAALIITHGRKRTRPDELLGVEARLRPAWVLRKVKGVMTPFPKIASRDKYGHYGYCVLEWTISPEVIRVAREDGRLWREGLLKLAAALDGLTINGWLIATNERDAA